MCVQFKGISAADRGWLGEYQPYLLPVADFTLKGELRVNAELVEKSARKLHFFHHTSPKQPNRWHIDDIYAVRVVVPHGGLPLCAWEIGGKIREMLPAIGVEKPEGTHLHSENDMACLATAGELFSRLSSSAPLSLMLEDAVIPFFYYQSFRAKFGGREPWPGLKHGAAGIFQSYQKNHRLDDNWRDYLFQLPKENASQLIHSNRKQLRNNVQLENNGRPRKKCFCTERIAKKCNCGAARGYVLLRDRVAKYLKEECSDDIDDARKMLQEECGKHEAFLFNPASAPNLQQD